MGPTVSIIVPVYRVAETLGRCVDSILHQEFKDLELLLVDDGSTDGSAALCDAYARQDDRVRVFHQQNQGVSAARNLGLQYAQGEYLQFADSDDWLAPDATKRLVSAAQENRCDLVIGDFYRVIGNRVAQKGDIQDSAVLTRQEYAAYMMENPADFYYGVLWNKLYRRDIVEQYHLRMNTDLTWCEDFLFNLEYIAHAERFYALQIPIYYYVRTRGSLASQSLSISKTVKMKLFLFEYYHQFYKSVLDEETYEKCRGKVYRFLFDAAQDGQVPPPMMAGARRLGNERVTVEAELLSEKDGPVQDGYLERKLMEQCVELAAMKHGLTLREAGLLLCMIQENNISTQRELEDFSNLPRRELNQTLKKLVNRGLIWMDTERAADPGDRRLHIEFSPEAEPILEDLERAQIEYEQIRYNGLTMEEQETWQKLAEKIRRNMKEGVQLTVL